MALTRAPADFRIPIELLVQTYDVSPTTMQVHHRDSRDVLFISPKPGAGHGGEPMVWFPYIGKIIKIPLSYIVGRVTFGPAVYDGTIGFADHNKRNCRPRNLILHTEDSMSEKGLYVASTASRNNAQWAFEVGYTVDPDRGQIISPSGNTLVIQADTRPDRNPVLRVNIHNTERATVINPTYLMVYALYGSEGLTPGNLISFANQDPSDFRAANLSVTRADGTTVQPLAFPHGVRPFSIYEQARPAAPVLPPVEVLPVPEELRAPVLSPAAETPEIPLEEEEEIEPVPEIPTWEPAAPAQPISLSSELPAPPELASTNGADLSIPRGIGASDSETSFYVDLLQKLLGIEPAKLRLLSKDRLRMLITTGLRSASEAQEAIRTALRVPYEVSIMVEYRVVVKALSEDDAFGHDALAPPKAPPGWEIREFTMNARPLEEVT